ncbi:MAG: PCMD domain-containing protein [Bacteroidales bacterium]|nr:PCMD domain-containing protein [Bacteroidales bacterium]
MRRLSKITAALLLLVSASSCLRNDMDYPVVLAGITDFKVGLQKGVKIDASARTVVVDLEETADISALNVESCVYTEGAQLSRDIPAVIDLSEPFKVTFTYYRDYEWTISATQTIERYVNVENQSGDPSISEDNHRIVLNVLNTQSLSSITFNSMKLGPRGSKVVSTTGYEKDGSTTALVTKDIRFPVTLDCVMDRTFDVLYKGKTTTWTLVAVPYTPPVEIKSIVPWAYSIDVKGSFNGAGSPELQYREAGEEEWQVWEDAKVAGVGISGRISDLYDGVEYEIRIVNGDMVSDVRTVRTDKATQLYNSNFDTWSTSGKSWCPYPANATDDQRVWDTANNATSFFAGNVTSPEESFVVKGKAVKMESVMVAGMLAGGNIYVGDFIKLQGLGAEIAWGFPFDSKPKALKGYYHYTPAKVTQFQNQYSYLEGKDDIGQFQILLTDWAAGQFHVLSAEYKFVDFENDPEIIAFSEVMLPKTEGDEYIEFTLPLEYRNYRTPKYIIIVACSSFYANYYTGGVGSTLYIDEFSLEYE